MPVLILLPFRLHRLRLLRYLTRLVFRTVLALLQIYFYKSLPAVCTLADIIYTGFCSVSHVFLLIFKKTQRNTSVATIVSAKEVSVILKIMKQI